MNEWKLLSLSLIVSAIALTYAYVTGPDKNNPENVQDIVYENLPPPVYQNAGIMWNRTGRTPQAPFRIETEYGEDYYIKLIEYTTGRDAIGIYVRGGYPIDIEVPLGTYIMRYASGKEWRGSQYLFGPGEMTSYSESLKKFNFADDGQYFTGYTVKLIPQVGGNMATKRINRSSF